MAKTDWRMGDVVHPEDMNEIGEEINELEAELRHQEARDLTISERLSIIRADQATSLWMKKLTGRTVVNHAPLFDSGLWVWSGNDVTIESSSKISIATDGFFTLRSPFIPCVEGEQFTVSANHNGFIRLQWWDRDRNYLGGASRTTERSQTRASSFANTAYLTIELSNNFTTGDANPGTFTFENVMLNKGSQPQEFVAGMKSLSGFYMKRYGQNLLPPFSEWNRSSNAKVVDSYKMELDASVVADVSYYDINVLEGQTYYLTFSSNDLAGYINVQLLDELGKSLGFYSGTPLFVPEGAKVARIRATNNVAGKFTFENPMLNLGSEPHPFEPKNNDYLVADVELASNLDGGFKETLEYRDGRYWKTKRIEKVALDGSVNVMESVANYTGCKRVGIQGLKQAAFNDGSLIKYSGIFLRVVSTFTGSQGDDWGFVSAFDNKTIYITVPNADSGWGDDYTPSVAEIKAYFYGWKMYEAVSTGNSSRVGNYNGTGVKCWAKIGKGTNYGTIPNTAQYTAPTILNGQGYAPYQLQYQLTTPIIEDVTDMVEGSISLHDGDNLMEIGEAVVVRETVDVDFRDNYYVINWGTGTSKLSYLPAQFLRIYADGADVTSQWELRISPSYANNIGCRKETIDQSEIYTVTYIAEPYAYSASVQSVDVQFNTNIKTALDRTLQGVADLTTRVNEIPRIYATISQEAVTHPTILGGWTSMDNFGYMKMSDGLVIFQGGVNGGGIVNANTVSLSLSAVPVCYLPPEYRPISPIVALVPCRTGTFSMGTWGMIRVHIHPADGKVAIYEHEGVQSAEYVWFDRIVYYRGFAP